MNSWDQPNVLADNYLSNQIKLTPSQKFKKILTFTIIDTWFGTAYTTCKLQGIPKTKILTEPDNRNKNLATDQDTKVKKFTISRKSKRN